MLKLRREPARSVFAAELRRGRFFPSNPLEKKPAYVLSPLGEKFSRVLLVGVVVEKFSSENFVSLTLEDGSESIRAKFFEQPLQEVEVGDLVLCVGKVKEFNAEVYVRVEIVRRISVGEELFFKSLALQRIFERVKIMQELRKLSEKLDASSLIQYAREKYGLDEEVASSLYFREEDWSEQILELIRSLDKGKGVEVEQLFSLAALPEEEVERAITKLLDSGKILEPEPGRFRCA